MNTNVLVPLHTYCRGSGGKGLSLAEGMSTGAGIITNILRTSI